MSSARGVTLVELLVTTSLMAVVGGATVAALTGGLRVSERASAVGVHRPLMLVALDGIRRDLQNARRFSPVKFEGAYDEMAFAAAGQVSGSQADAQEIGRLGYFLDERRKMVCRSFVPYRQIRRVDVTDRCQPVLEDATRLRFHYFGAGGWMERWSSPLPPKVVKIEVSRDAGRGQLLSESFLVYLPDPGAADAK